MIARIWRGATPLFKADDYFRYMKKTGLKESTGVKGNCGVLILRKDHQERAEFHFISLWESMDVIKKFSGSDVTKAVYYPEDEDYLIEMEPNVAHHRVLANLSPINQSCDTGIRTTGNIGIIW